MKKTALVIVLVIVPAATMLLVAGLVLGGKPRQAPGSLSVSPTFAAIDGSRAGENGERTFRLTNNTRTPITVRTVDHCPACNTINDLRGKVLQLSEFCDSIVRVQIPKAGLDVQQLTIWHNDGIQPLRLTLDILGRQAPPYLTEKYPPNVAFFGLESAASTQELRVTSCEQTGTKPWLNSLSCDLPEVKIEKTEFAEQIYDTKVLRKYIFRISWRQLPTSPEFNGKLWTEGNSAGNGERTEVCQLIGTRSRK